MIFVSCQLLVEYRAEAERFSVLSKPSAKEKTLMSASVTGHPTPSPDLCPPPLTFPPMTLTPSRAASEQVFEAPAPSFTRLWQDAAVCSLTPSLTAI